MKIRDILPKERDKFEVVGKEQGTDLPTPNILNVEQVIENGEGIAVAYGCLSKTPEAVLVLHPQLDHRSKVVALKLLIEELDRLEDGEIVCFSRDEAFLDILVKHFGAEYIPEKAVVINPKR